MTDREFFALRETHRTPEQIEIDKHTQFGDELDAARKADQLADIRAEELFTAPKKPHYLQDNQPGEELAEVERENVEATRHTEN